MTQQHAPSCSGTYRHFSREKKEGGKREKSSEDGKRRVRGQNILGKRDEKKGKEGNGLVLLQCFPFALSLQPGRSRNQKTKRKEKGSLASAHHATDQSQVNPATHCWPGGPLHRTALSQGFKVSALACPALHHSVHTGNICTPLLSSCQVRKAIPSRRASVPARAPPPLSCPLPGLERLYA